MSLSIALAQNDNRIKIYGKVFVDSYDVEGLVVNNLTSKSSTITDMYGEFNINVKLNDHIKISALHFDTVHVIITKEIIKSKLLTVFLDERLTALDEVVILPFSLTGDLEADLLKVRTFNPKFEIIYFGNSENEETQYSDIQYQKVENTILSQGRFYNGVDLVKITNWLVKPLFTNKTNSKETKTSEISNFENLRDTYTKDFISSNFNIPGDKVNDFIAFSLKNNTNPSLYEKGKDIELIEYLVNQSKLFLKTESSRN